MQSETKHKGYIMEYRIKEICKEKGILIKELAAKMGISDASLRSTIKGNPTIATLEKIASVLGVEVSELFKPSASSQIVCPHCGKTIALKADKQ